MLKTIKFAYFYFLTDFHSSKCVFGSFLVFFAKSWPKNMYCSAISRFFLGGWPFLPDDLRWPWNVLCSSWMVKLLEMVTENLHTKFEPIRRTELSVIAIYTQIASGHILLAVRGCASVAIFSKVDKAPPYFFTCSMMMLWRTSGVNFVHFGAGKSV